MKALSAIIGGDHGRALSRLRKMVADNKDDLIGCLAAKQLNTRGGWSPTKERMRQHLERLTCMHGC